MAKHKGSLLRQLTLSLGLAIIFLSLSSFYYQYQVEKHILMANIRSDLVRQGCLLRTWLGEAASPEERRSVAQQYVQTLAYLEKTKQEIIIVDDQSRVLAASTGLEPGADFGMQVLKEVMAPDAPPDGKTLVLGSDYIIALPFYADKRVAGAIHLKQPLTAVEHLADSLMLGAFILLAVTLAIIVVVVYVVLRLKVHKPMQAIFMQEYRIREGDLARIEAEDPANEFSDLYAMYNEMVLRIAEQKKAILEQKDHVALAQLVRHAVARLTGPLEQIGAESRLLLEHESSLSDADRTTLKQIIANVTRIVRELKAIVLEGDKSATWLKHEAEKVREHTDVKKPTDEKAGGKYPLE